VALARPQTTVQVPREEATVLLVTDVSGSMNATDIEPTRLAAAQARRARSWTNCPMGSRWG
jgi:Ca-activated chloride channel family protein